MKRTRKAVVLVLVLFFACQAPKQDSLFCPAPYQYYDCTVANTGPVNPFPATHLCEPSLQAAEYDAKVQAGRCISFKNGEKITNVVCKLSTDGGPGPTPQGLPPSCDPNAADNACLACAKVSCCGEYQSCFLDTTCACLVVCLESSSVSFCTAPDQCGPVSEVTISTMTCLAAACAGPCPTVGAMGPGSMCPTMSGSGGSGSGTTTAGCTPGTFGPGESCFSNGDCTSCTCDMQTMTCE